MRKYLVFLLEKELSKFEQCSAWDCFPLRKAQIHYAALDSFILIKIYEELKKMHQFEEEMHTDNDVVKALVIKDDGSETNSLFED